MTATVHPLQARGSIPTIKAVAAYALWETRRFDTAEIAAALSIHVVDVKRILRTVRENTP